MTKEDKYIITSSNDNTDAKLTDSNTGINQQVYEHPIALNTDSDTGINQQVYNHPITLNEDGLSLDDVCKSILFFLDSHKAENIILYEFPKYQISFEKMITCRVTSGRRAIRLAENLMEYLKNNNISSRISNLGDPEWVAVFNDDLFVVHILTEMGVEYFKLNELLESRKVR